MGKHGGREFLDFGKGQRFPPKRMPSYRGSLNARANGKVGHWISGVVIGTSVFDGVLRVMVSPSAWAIFSPACSVVRL